MKFVVEASRKKALRQEEAGIAPPESDSDESSPKDTPEEEHNEGVPEYTPQETRGAGEEVGESYNVPRDAEPVREPLGAVAPEVSVPPESVLVPSPTGGDAELRHPDPDSEDHAADLNTCERQLGSEQDHSPNNQSNLRGPAFNVTAAASQSFDGAGGPSGTTPTFVPESPGVGVDVEEALADARWTQDMAKEMVALEKNAT
ncbi:hypothetical protein LWI29_013126 [Acer saccharum]|uniref:Uncharacterized protein n=1 Tax=Acer saccharum TaxID=4024 RepID=A0AA39S3G1_ACESA|nr:hypothetical protein LWI29_013126 [Acer saccharum]